MNKIKTGINDFDTIMDGGLPEGRSCLIAGEPGTGKTIFSLQFLLEGAKQGEHGVYISIDEKPEQIIENAKTLGWDLAPFLENKSIEFLDISKYFGSQNVLSEEFNFDRIIDNIIDFIQKRSISRLIIDPLSPLIFSVQKHPNVARYIRQLVFRLEETGSYTTLMTSPIPVGSRLLSKNSVEEFISSGVIHLTCERQENRHYQRYLTVKKMRGTAIDLNEHKFIIQADSGITLS